ncbi:hypothetical protein NECID01_0270 [Nematocida sp. AWRm77]|nr:hypothetical protein NECID01_0270 [Nematocida sp. AWRm77]
MVNFLVEEKSLPTLLGRADSEKRVGANLYKASSAICAVFLALSFRALKSWYAWLLCVSFFGESLHRPRLSSVHVQLLPLLGLGMDFLFGVYTFGAFLIPAGIVLFAHTGALVFEMWLPRQEECRMLFSVIILSVFIVGSRQFLVLADTPSHLVFFENVMFVQNMLRGVLTLFSFYATYVYLVALKRNSVLFNLAWSAFLLVSISALAVAFVYTNREAVRVERLIIRWRKRGDGGAKPFYWKTKKRSHW